MLNKKWLINLLNKFILLEGKSTKCKYKAELEYWKNTFRDKNHKYYWQNDEVSLKFTFDEYCAELCIDKNYFRNKIVIDVGCGPRGSLHHFNARMKFGVDILANEYNKKFSIVKHDMVYLNCLSHKRPFLNEFADIVISRNALDHVGDFESTIDEIYRVLKPHGEILLSMNLRYIPTINEPQVITEERIRKAFFGKLNYGIVKKHKPTDERPYEIVVIKGNKI